MTSNGLRDAQLQGWVGGGGGVLRGGGGGGRGGVGSWGGGRVAGMFFENGNRALFVTPKTHQQTDRSCDAHAE